MVNAHLACTCGGYDSAHASKCPRYGNDRSEAHEEAFSSGFDSGNYGNAYESQDWDSWYARNCETPAEYDADAYREGLILGFFSSYEISEISDPEHAETVEALRAKHGED